MRVLDLFCGRFGWGRAFAARGHEVVGIDLVEPLEVPVGCRFIAADIFSLQCLVQRWYVDTKDYQGICVGDFDFICASSPCEQFSVHGMKHFHPNPPYPEMGIKLFNHTRALCEASGVPYVMENVRAAQAFVGTAAMVCGPFTLWGSGVPVLMPQGIKKGIRLATGYAGFKGKFAMLTREQKREARKGDPMLWASSRSPARKEATAKAATIPPELANCVCDYAERLTEPSRAGREE